LPLPWRLPNHNLHTFNHDEETMPSLNLSTKTIRYTAIDENALKMALVLCGYVSEWGACDDAKRDAKTAETALRHLVEHVATERNGKAK
jgi:hypothetical protein